MTRKTNAVEDMLYYFKNTEAVKKHLQKFDDFFRMMLDVQKRCNSLLPPAEQQRDEEWFDDLDHNLFSFQKRKHSWIKGAEAERQSQLSSKRSVSTKASSQSRSSERSSSKANSRSSREKRALEERIKMAGLMAEADNMEKKHSLEFENLRIQLATENANLKSRVKICDTNVGEQGKVHVRYNGDKIGMSPDADRVPCNEKLYRRSYRNTWDPDEDDKLVHLTRGCNAVEKGNIKKTSSDSLYKLLQR